MKIEGFGFALGQNCIIDIFFAIVCTVAKYDIVAMQGYSIYSPTFIKFSSSHLYVEVCVILLYFTTNMTFYAIGIPFYVRYMKVCKRISLSWKKITLFYIGLVMYEVIVLYFIQRAYQVNPKELEELRMRPRLLPNSTGKFWNFAAAKLVSFDVSRICQSE